MAKFAPKVESIESSQHTKIFPIYAISYKCCISFDNFHSMLLFSRLYRL